MRKIAHWLECYEPGESIDILRDLALSHCREGGELGKKIAAAIRRCDFKAVCEFELDYQMVGLTADHFAHCRQALAFFSKLEHLDIGVDKEEVAWRKFSDSELLCRETNEIFRLWRRGEFQFRSRVESWFFKAQRKIARTLGPVPKFNQLGYRFGRGATTLTQKRNASVPEKLGAGVSCSEDLFPFAKAILEELPHLCQIHSVVDRADEDGEEWFRVPIVIHDGRLEFVPKSAKTYRSIATEPVLNGMFQMAVGDLMTSRLARSGLDLRDQSLNQRLALEGSLTGALATLDLSSASDTISKELVYSLLPLDWANFLAKGRCSHVTYRGNRIRLEKFSSMGNGFTFPLESLIFWALAHAVCEDDETVSVYGDDIIVPTHRYTDLVELLTAAGFLVNETKSFHKGPFRESCGRDFYLGLDIRPYYQKDWVSNRSLFVLHNFYVRHGDAVRAEAVVRLIHPSLRIYGPDGYGDGHLLGDHLKLQKLRHSQRGWAGYTFDTFTVRPRRDIRPQRLGDCVLPMYSVYRRSAEPVLKTKSLVELGLVTLIREVTLEDFSSAPSSYWSTDKLVSFVRLCRAFGSLEDTIPIPDSKNPDGTSQKAVSLPLDEGTYKRVSIYTLGA